MIIIEIEKTKDSLEKALKKLKRKFDKTGVVKQLRKRKEYVKPSEEKRNEIRKARYIQSKFGNETNND